MSGLVNICVEHGVKILAYGVLAGGFLTDTWLGAPKPSNKVGVCVNVTSKLNSTFVSTVGIVDAWHNVGNPLRVTIIII